MLSLILVNEQARARPAPGAESRGAFLCVASALGAPAPGRRHVACAGQPAAFPVSHARATLCAGHCRRRSTLIMCVVATRCRKARLSLMQLVGRAARIAARLPLSVSRRLVSHAPRPWPRRRRYTASCGGASSRRSRRTGRRTWRRAWISSWRTCSARSSPRTGTSSRRRAPLGVLAHAHGRAGVQHGAFRSGCSLAEHSAGAPTRATAGLACAPGLSFVNEHVAFGVMASEPRFCMHATNHATCHRGRSALCIDTPGHARHHGAPGCTKSDCVQSWWP